MGLVLVCSLLRRRAGSDVFGSLPTFTTATTQQMPSNKRFLVVGGGGFLGRNIVDMLLDRGEKYVRVFDLRKTFDDVRVEFVLGDMTKLEDISKACQGIDCVIHTASPNATTQNYDLFYNVNVRGTENVVQACLNNNVKQLVYTCSASIVFDGHDLNMANESTPTCKHHLDQYSYTKELGERAVLAANGKNGLLTCSIRPSGLFGPRDVQAWPGFINVGKQGKSRLQIGFGGNKFDWTYIDNVSHAHLLAAEKLTPGSPVAGQVYFITNDTPTPFWSMANFVYENFGYPTTSIKLPYLLLWYIAVLLSYITAILAKFGVKFDPTFTPLRVANAGANRTYDISKAKRELGYAPIVSLEEGKKRTLQYFRQQRAEGKI